MQVLSYLQLPELDMASEYPLCLLRGKTLFISRADSISLTGTQAAGRDDDDDPSRSELSSLDDDLGTQVPQPPVADALVADGIVRAETESYAIYQG